MELPNNLPALRFRCSSVLSKMLLPPLSRISRFIRSRLTTGAICNQKKKMTGQTDRQRYRIIAWSEEWHIHTQRENVNQSDANGHWLAIVLVKEPRRMRPWNAIYSGFPFPSLGKRLSIRYRQTISEPEYITTIHSDSVTTWHKLRPSSLAHQFQYICYTPRPSLRFHPSQMHWSQLN